MKNNKSAVHSTLTGDFISRQTWEDHCTLEQQRQRAFSGHKQRVLETVIERMRAEKTARQYEEHKKNRPDPRRILSDYA